MRALHLLLFSLFGHAALAAATFDPSELATAQFANIMEQVGYEEKVAEAKKQLKYLENPNSYLYDQLASYNDPSFKVTVLDSKGVERKVTVGEIMDKMDSQERNLKNMLRDEASNRMYSVEEGTISMKDLKSRSATAGKKDQGASKGSSESKAANELEVKSLVQLSEFCLSQIDGTPALPKGGKLLGITTSDRSDPTRKGGAPSAVVLRLQDKGTGEDRAFEFELDFGSKKYEAPGVVVVDVWELDRTPVIISNSKSTGGKKSKRTLQALDNEKTPERGRSWKEALPKQAEIKKGWEEGGSAKNEARIRYGVAAAGGVCVVLGVVGMVLGKGSKKVKKDN